MDSKSNQVVKQHKKNMNFYMSIATSTIYNVFLIRSKKMCIENKQTTPD